MELFLQSRDGGPVFIEQQPHDDTVKLVNRTTGTPVDLQGQTVNAFATGALEGTLVSVVPRRLPVNAGVVQDCGEPYEPTCGILHSAPRLRSTTQTKGILYFVPSHQP